MRNVKELQIGLEGVVCFNGWGHVSPIFAVREIVSTHNVLNNNELLMNLWVSCAVCAVWVKLGW